MVVLPAPFGPIRPVNSPGRIANPTSVQDLPAGQPDADPVEAEQFAVVAAVGAIGHHSFSADFLLATACWRARVSASIQDW